MLNKREVLRYLGAAHSDEALDGMIDRAERELLSAVRPKYTAKRFDISVSSTGVSFGATKLESRDLASHLSGCAEAFLFACTLGPGVDTLIRRCEVAEIPMVPILQACAAEYTEVYADRAQQELEAYAAAHSLYLRPRYSPGYGDFPLEYQQFLFDALDISKKIGVALTDSFLMVPFKSVTAVIGLSKDPSLCHVGKCMTCSAQNCPFRKEISHE